MIGNVTSGEGTDDFFEAQLRQLEVFKAQAGHGRVALGRVIVPFDGADAVTRQRYRAYGEGRDDRTGKPHGERRTLFARDLVGPSQAIVEALLSDPVFAEVEELRLELPYSFRHEDYEQILSDVVEHIAPVFGWTEKMAETKSAPASA